MTAPSSPYLIKDFQKKVSWGQAVDISSSRDSSSKDGRNLIKVEVGSGDALRRFTVRKNFLCYGSEHFARLLSGCSEREGNATISVPDHEVAVFEVYQHWIYRRQILTNMVQGPRLWREQARKSLVIQEQRLLIAAYVFADKIKDTDFADAVLDSVLNCAMVENQWPASSLADAAFQVASGALELLLVDLLVFNHDPGDYYAKAKNVLLQKPDWDSTKKLGYLDRIAGSVVAAFAKKRDQERPPWEDDRCRYHLHGSRRTCYTSSMVS